MNKLISKHLAEANESWRIAIPRALANIWAGMSKLIGKVSEMRSASSPQKIFGYDDFHDRQRSAYHRYSISAGDRSIDDQTWKDLMVEDMLKSCAKQSSIHGIQKLYATLRVGGGGLHRGKLGEWLVLGERLQTYLDKLRNASSEVATALCGPSVFTLPAWAKRVHLIPWVEGATFFFVIYMQWWPAFFAAVGVSFFIHGLIQINLYPHLMAWRDLQRELVLLLDVAAELNVVLTDDSPVLFLTDLKHAPIKAIRRDIAPSVLEAVPGFSEYSDLLFLHSFAKLDKARLKLAAHKADLLSIFECLATLEMHCCVARFRSSYSITSDVRPPKDGKLSLMNAENPLLPGGLRFSIAMSLNGAIITGKNGVGKSTLLRGTGLNLVLGRAFGFCIASTAELPDLMPWSSIQNEDSLLLGESLYMAEMRRANELIAAASHGDCAFFVDELFRGTNNVESVAAAAAVLEELARCNIAIANSHNTILTSILAPSFTPLALRRWRDDQDRSHLELAPGVESETNGVAMMSDFALPASVIKRAEAIANWYLQDMLNPQNPERKN